MARSGRADATDGIRIEENLPRIRPALAAAAFLVLAVFYAVIAPANRTEATDGLWYAADVERLEWPGLYEFGGVLEHVGRSGDAGTER